MARKAVLQQLLTELSVGLPRLLRIDGQVEHRQDLLGVAMRRINRAAK